MSHWSVCGSGPSLDLVTELPGQFKVAINSALVRSDLGFTHWCMIDFPEMIRVRDLLAPEYWKTVRSTVTLWRPLSWEGRGKLAIEAVSESMFFRYQESFPFGTLADWKGKVLDAGPDVPWSYTSVSVALALAIAHGAKRIDVFGADMTTWNYHKVDEHLIRERDRQHRWTMERNRFAAMIRAAKENGITIRRCKPATARCAAHQIQREP